MKMKICLVGQEAVGKTSLIRRFVHSEFGEEYLRTVGTRVSKKVVTLGPIDGITYEMSLLVWDLMGRQDFMALYKEAYFSRARGILAVCDLTRPKTLDSLHGWFDGISSSLGPVSTILLGNKFDMKQHLRVEKTDILAFCKLHGVPYLQTSAKTGENVETAFTQIATLGLRSRSVGREP